MPVTALQVKIFIAMHSKEIFRTRKIWETQEFVRQNRKRLEAEKKAAELAEKQRLQKIARE
jgi:hypothetical protein